MAEVKLYLGDCLEILPTLADGSVDAVITDPPYGTTACKWDTVIPFEPMWAQLGRIAKTRAAIVLFGSQPFTSALVMSKPEWFKYEWILEKGRAANFLQAKAMPLMYHENIVIFSDGTINHLSAESDRMLYHPQMREGKSYQKTERHGGASGITATASIYPGYVKINKGTRYPGSVLSFKSNNHGSLHPTQKPVALLEYLVRTYTNPGDTVLDFTMGSGTTGVACVQTGRNFIGIEIDPAYYAIAEKRIAGAQLQMPLELV